MLLRVRFGPVMSHILMRSLKHVLGAILTAGAAFVLWGPLVYLGYGWFAFFLQRLGVPSNTRERIADWFLRPEVWFFAPTSIALWAMS